MSEPENTIIMETSKGKVVIQLRPDLAPAHCDRIRELAREEFYDGIIFHRVLDNFMAQVGCPDGTGTGGSSKPDLNAEFNSERHVRGTCSMARTNNPNSANSQFFICFGDTSHLDGQYTVWGQVTEGMDAVDALAKGQPPRNPDSIITMRVRLTPEFSHTREPWFEGNGRDRDRKKRLLRRRGSKVIGSRIARLIFASNLAGLIILIIGAMVLNEMRAGFVLSKKQDLVGQAQIFANIIANEATTAEPRMNLDAARNELRKLNLPESVRAKIHLTDGDLVGDSFFLSARVDVSSLGPVQEPGRWTRVSTGLSEWASSVFGPLLPRSSSTAVRTQTFEEEFNIAIYGGDAASQRFSDRGSRIISVSVPIQRVSAVVGVLTLEASDIDEVIRAERAALIPFIGVAILMALVTSFLLTLGIARPLRRLSIAADRIRAGSSNEIDIPALSNRKDEIGHLAQSLQAMTGALLERIQSNEQFAADVAHELKNPLTSIRSAIETAERVQEDPVARERLRAVIAQDVRRLDRLITDISNASRLEAEMTRVPNEKLRIASFIRDVVSTYDAVSEGGEETTPRARVAFTDATMGAGLIVRGREGPLGQVLRNLIDNARSFSPQDGLVSVRLLQTNKGPQTIARIVVEDNGPGIPADKLEKVFDRFYTDRPKGTAFGNNSGLGLSIVKQIIETHRGTVIAENRAEGGARFTVDLPAI